MTAELARAIAHGYGMFIALAVIWSWRDAWWPRTLDHSSEVRHED